MKVIPPNFEFEKSLLPPGTRYLLGIDEVGRGPLAGPVTITAFLLDLSLFDPTTFANIGVRDSKLLSPTRRQSISVHLRSFSHLTLSSSSQDIDDQGIKAVLQDLFLSALNRFRGQFDFCLIDGNSVDLTHLAGNVNSPHHKTSLPERCKFVVKGDQQCFSIAAASIIAKVTRDAVMDDYHRQYPQYGFDRHKGYGTSHHLAALHQHGPCPIHRRSFAPLKTLFPLSS